MRRVSAARWGGEVLAGRDMGAETAPEAPAKLYVTARPEIRAERRPNSRYASLENCRHEVAEAEAMMRRSGIRWLSTTTKSIEEIATTILQEVRPERVSY